MKKEIQKKWYPHAKINDIWIDIKDKRILQLGFGAIGSCMLPLYRRHIKMNRPDQVTIIDMNKKVIPTNKNEQQGAVFIHQKVTQEN